MAGGLKELIEELLEPLGGTSIRSMFGGHGVFRDGIMFGILDDDVLYFRADEKTQPHFEAEKSKQFTYPGKGRLMVMPYWQVPERLFDDADEFVTWAKTSFAVARDARSKKPKKSAAKAKAKSKPRPKAKAKPKAKPKKKAAPKRR